MTEFVRNGDGEPVKLYFDSASAYIKEPGELNRFKSAMDQWGFMRLA